MLSSDTVVLKTFIRRHAMADLNVSRSHQRYARRFNEYLSQKEKERFKLGEPGSRSLAAWFLGPVAENRMFFLEQLTHAFKEVCDYRLAFSKHFDDPPFVTDERRLEPDFDPSKKLLADELHGLLQALKKSVPFFSYRYQAHMNWDLTMAGMLGYITAMFFNQNNVALEASPVTSQLESEVGKDLCRMLGFAFPPSKEQVPPWGHITCDGSVANLEAMWAARNLKYYPLAIAAAMRSGAPELAPAKAIKVPVYPQLDPQPLIEMDPWTLLNLPIDSILELSPRLTKEYGVSTGDIDKALDGYLLQNLGFSEFGENYSHVFKESMRVPIIFGPATKHYSWPKGASILGIGRKRYVDVNVDLDARMDITDLRRHLDGCLDPRSDTYHCPVLMVVVVLGSTEESAVDPLAEVLALRKEYHQLGLEFMVHVDAAWGGYFASLLRSQADLNTVQELRVSAPPPQDTPVLQMSQYATAQFQAIPGADSVTIDPHKAGYIPYPAGGLCYKKKTMRDMVTFKASEVFHEGDELDASMGVFGVEGSKPGAAAAAAYLSHRVIRPDISGYGQILGKALFNSKRFYASVVTMAQKGDPFIVVPVQRLPAEKEGKDVEAQRKFIRERIVNRQNNEIEHDPEAMELMMKLGSDQIIITYAFNFFKKDGKLNSDPLIVNQFNNAIFEKLSIAPGAAPTGTPLVITTSEFDPAIYGEKFVKQFMQRLLGSKDPQPIVMNFLSSTTMSPWLTATERGNFIPELEQCFRAAVLEVVHKFQDSES
jgi:glutamate/tyrosine decarboxylase-like PLP-dependent enzyme